MLVELEFLSGIAYLLAYGTVWIFAKLEQLERDEQQR